MEFYEEVNMELYEEVNIGALGRGKYWSFMKR